MTELEVGISFIQQKDTYLLQRRPLTAMGAAGLIGAYGGKLEPGENALEAVCRELSEETSLNPSTEDFKFLGMVTVAVERHGGTMQITASVFRLMLSEHQSVTSLEGELVQMTHEQMITAKDELTPATKAAFEQFL